MGNVFGQLFSNGQHLGTRVSHSSVNISQNSTCKQRSVKMEILYVTFVEH